MISGIISVILAATFTLFSSITVSACSPQNNVMNMNVSDCPANSSINIEYYINPTLEYFRPTEIGVFNPSLSSAPKYFALSAGALAMTQTLNELFQNFQTVHFGGASLFNVSVPVILNGTDGAPCLSSATLSIIPQYTLEITDIGAGTYYYMEASQGQANNRESCKVCNSNTTFAVIHGELSNAGLFDVTSQVCNAFNIPVIAASVTDLTFQELYPAAQAAAPWSALSSTSPTQISSALKAFMAQFNWNFIVMFTDPNDQDQANEMSEIAFGISFVPFQNIDSTGTGCSLALLGVVESGISIMYLDMAIARCSQCVNQILTSGLLQMNYIVIWGPTLMASVNNDLQTLASAANLSVSNFVGTFSLQVRMKIASFAPELFNNINALFASWNASFLSQYESLDITSIYDHANSVILASQGIAGLFANQLCLFGNRGIISNLSDSPLNSLNLVSEITTSLLSFLSSSQSSGNYTIQSVSESLWKITLPINELYITPSQAFQYYSQSSGIWSEAVNIEQWYHDYSGNSLIILDVYNLVQNPVSENNLIGSYMASSYSWMPNPMSVIVWPNNSSLWQYTSGQPSYLAPLSNLALSCVTNDSCSGKLMVDELLHGGIITSYSTEITLSGTGEWNLQIECSEAGSVPSFGAALSQSSDASNAWTLLTNQYSGQIQVKVDTQLFEPNLAGMDMNILSFWCTNGFSVLNSTLIILVETNSPNYDPSDSDKWGAGTANVVGIVISILGAISTMFYRHRRPIYSASVPFLMISWVGFALLFGSGLLSILPVTGNNICQARPWLFHYGFTLVMGSIFLKTYHIHSIFNNDKLVIRQISMWHFILSLGCMLSSMTVVMLVWQLLGSAQLYRVSDLLPYCATGSWVPFHFIAALELLLVFGCLFVSYLIRRVHQDYNESKCIVFISYNTLFWGITWWVLSSQESVSEPTLSLITSVFICAVTFISMITFFFPKFYALSREDVKTLAITPRSGRSKLVDSAVRLSAIEASAGLTAERLSVNQTEFNVPEDPKEALRQFREKLFDTIRKWKANDVEHRRLKGKIQEHERIRDRETQSVNNWMNAIRIALTSNQLSSRDQDGLVGQMTNIVRMNVDQLMDEAEKFEDSSKKRTNALAAASSPKFSTSRPLGQLTPKYDTRTFSNQQNQQHQPHHQSEIEMVVQPPQFSI
jgi:hypothetical protein